MWYGGIVPPGHTTFTRMRCGASSTASARVKPSSAAFVVSYCPMPARPITPDTHAPFPMAPPPAVPRGVVQEGPHPRRTQVRDGRLARVRGGQHVDAEDALPVLGVGLH